MTESAQEVFNRMGRIGRISPGTLHPPHPPHPVTCSWLLALGLVLTSGPCLAEDKPAWTGVDEAVVERIARESGRPPAEPLINTDQGDLLLFLFLAAGAAGGFVAGWSARTLFGRKP